jgi:aspartate/methionine/tyrosine aminotransferase
MTRVVSSPYIEWAKLHSHARWNLATSGVLAVPLAELGVTMDDLEITGPSFYGFPPLQAALSGAFRIDEASIVTAIGTSLANHLAIAAIIEPGDEVAFEWPTYEPMLSTAEYLGARIVRFPRPAAQGVQIDLDELARAVTSRTRLIVSANLHNPSGAYTDLAALKQVRAIADRVGARVLIDEVYLDAVFDQGPPSAFHLGPTFVVTGSLTKVYGLSGLRCGWIFAEPGLARRIWRLNDLYGNIPAHSAERLSIVALARLDRLRGRARAIVESNRALVQSFLSSRDDLEPGLLPYGTTTFPRVHGDVTRLCDVLRHRYDASVVPGHFFEQPDHIRIGMGGRTDELREGLDRLGRALDDVRAGR